MASTTTGATLTLDGPEFTLIAHARGWRHNSDECAWCRDTAYFSRLYMAANRQVRDLLNGA